jgi:hypothetical protein
MARSQLSRKRRLTNEPVLMSRSLIQLIYCSRQNIFPPKLDLEIDAIIKASVRNNRDSRVTGLLLSHQGWFLQVLEGAPVAVQTTFGRIINDSRHAGSHVITAAPIDERMFGEWDMCARQLRKEDGAILGVLDAKNTFEPTRFDAKTSLRLLMAVRNIRGRLRLDAQSIPNASQITVEI